MALTVFHGSHIHTVAIVIRVVASSLPPPLTGTRNHWSSANLLLFPAAQPNQSCLEALESLQLGSLG